MGKFRAFIFTVMGAGICATISTYAQEASIQPTLVNANITTVYTPVGFDDNDNAQIIVEGELPNTCYKVGPSRVRVDRDNQVIQFQQLVFRYNGLCLEVKTPFVKTIDIGVLPEGRYQVVSVNKEIKPAILGVHHTENRMPDEFIYAPVDAAVIRKDDLGGRRILMITGAFPNSCMKFPEETNSVIAKMTGKNIIEVLPIVQMDKGPCLNVMVPFGKSVVLNGDIPTGKYLLYIRTLNGQSYTKLDFIGDDPQ